MRHRWAISFTFLAPLVALGADREAVATVAPQSTSALISRPKGHLQDVTSFQIVDLRRGVIGEQFDVELGGITSIAILPNNAQVVAGSESGQLAILNASSGGSVRAWQAHDGRVLHVDARFGKDYQRRTAIVTSAGADGLVRTWVGGVDRMIAEVDLGMTPQKVDVGAVDFIVALSDRGDLAAFESRTGRRVGPLPEMDGKWIDFASARDRLLIVAARADGTVYTFTGSRFTPQAIGAGSWGNVSRMAVLPKGQAMLLQRSDLQNVMVDLRTGVEVDRWRDESPALAILPTPDAKALLFVQPEGFEVVAPRREDAQNSQPDAEYEIPIF